MTLKNDRFIRALKRQPVDRTPLWMMRQAGRYLPEYREVRAQAGDFLTLCKTPELACEVTMQPLRRYGFDAAILFSDILTIPDAMGLGLYFSEGEGPKFKSPIKTVADIDKLGVPDPNAELGYVVDAVKTIKSELNQSVPLIGFSGSPWTLATYMLEGGSSKQFKTSKTWIYNEPEAAAVLLDKLSQAVSQYLCAQIEAGADAVMVFDTWGGILPHAHYQSFSLKYMRDIVHDVKSFSPDTPIVLFTKGGGQWLELIAETGCDGVGIDWTVDISQARERVGVQVALQGNMDPCLLYASPEVIEQSVADVLSGFGAGTGHVFNLGHGILPDVPPEHVSAFVEAVRNLSPKYHQ